MSINWHLDVTPRPAVLVLPRGAASLDDAHQAIELWEHYSGKTLDGTQRLTVEVMMAQADDGRWAAATTGREMPRQNGKGDEIEVVELWGLVKRAESILHTVHDAVLLASQAQQRMLAVLERPDLRKKVLRKWQGTGQQMIEMRNGGCIWYRTRTGGGGRGVDDIDRLVVDEAQHATEEHLAAITPTLLANSNPQLNAAGTAALPGKSDWWWGVRRRALGDDPGSFGYVGHTAELNVHIEDGRVIQPPVDVADRKLWQIANPASLAGRSDVMGFLEEQYRRLGPDSFAQEHLGVWAPPDSEVHEAKLDETAWKATACVDGPPAGRVVFGFDVDLDSAHASICVAAGTAGAPYLEQIEHQGGVGWLPSRLVELVRKWDPLHVAYNAAGPALEQIGAVQVAFRDAGLSTDVLVPLNAGEYRAACGALFSHVAEGTLTRPTGSAALQGPLDRAALDASERPLAEGWVWHRRQATVPISPLVAGTVACHLLPVEAHKIDAAANVW